MAATSAAALFNAAELQYTNGRRPEAFEFYRRAILQILDHEDVLQNVPGVPVDFPQELIAIVWQNFLGCFRETGSQFTQESSPEAYDLVYSFRPSASSRTHPQFTGQQGRRLLKAMQISAALTLGIIAWEKGDRSTTAKRYQEALDVAATHPPFNAVNPNARHLDRRIALEVQQIRDNLAVLIRKDSHTAQMAGGGQGALRKDVLNVPHTRIDDVEGSLLGHQDTFMVATDACGRVGCIKRGVNFKRCSACKKTAYCSVECQKEDWKAHKKTHTF
ncbi:hypothetical protein C8R43DRAFT_1012417 [Mycena crocata]|nr:hypothetical protein C8R43DRAFT_1012417 [Mycena crocata]